MSVRAKANKYGEVPTPPYIENSKFEIRNSKLEQRYQTVYAKEEGSVAAPTAGFHFTPELIAKLKTKGVEFAEVTLHVGLGTFLPVKTDSLEEHHMHSEWVELTSKNTDLINSAKAEGRRVVAVGTTTVRALEGVARLSPSYQEGVGGVAEVMASQLRPYSGDINIFIFPGFKFKVVDALITNFHLPKSTLLMLVCAFAGDREFVLECYQKAVEEKYRFFSFGDAMLIH
jgi:S-adenosylmethionine:tRNA ribosyltransferase-isomerase